MRHPFRIAFAAILCAGVAGPALAAWDRIGSVDFSARPDRDTQYGNFGGSVESLALMARNGDVACRSVMATFGNGRTRNVFSGTLPQGRNITLDVPGNERMVRRLDFNCRSLERRNATVDISADIGRYQAEWRQSPDWARVWSRMFNWGPDRDFGRDRGWTTLGTASFEGRRDRETEAAGWGGRDVDTLALRPINDDAQCRQVRVTFANGRTRTVLTGARLREDRITRIDLPGRDRNIRSVQMNCHAVNGRQVAIEVLADDRTPERFGFNYRR